MVKTIVAGLDVGTSAIRIVAVLPSAEARAPRVLAAVKKESHGLRRGYIINLDEAQRALKETLREAERLAKGPIRSIYLGLGGISLDTKTSEGSTTISRADLEVQENDIERALDASEQIFDEWPNRKILHRIPLGFKLDGKKVLGRPGGLRGRKLEVRTLFIHCLSQHFNDLIRLAQEAGLVVEDVIAAPLAASFPTLTTTQKAAGCMLANIGGQTTSVIVFEEGVPIGLQVFPVGSNDITNDIALGLRLPLEDAEQLKLASKEVSGLPNVKAGAKRKLDEIIEARLSDMFELIETHLKKLGRSGLLPAGIILIGGGAGVENLESLAKNYLRLPATLFNPAQTSQLKNQVSDPSWMVAYGLCLYGQEEGPETALGNRVFRQTKGNFFRWLKELWP